LDHIWKKNITVHPLKKVTDMGFNYVQNLPSRIFVRRFYKKNLEHQHQHESPLKQIGISSENTVDGSNPANRLLNI